MIEKPKQPEQDQETEKEPKKVFLEIGTSQLPVSWIGAKRFEDTVYIGIDLDDRDIKAAKDSSRDGVFRKKSKQELKNLNFIKADATETPLKDNSVDEVFIGNVAGAISNWITKKILGEARRVIKPTGKLVIKETNTPEDLELLKNTLMREGFSIEKIVTSNSSDLEEAIDPYEHLIKMGETKNRFRLTESYIIFAKPNK